jgi:LacI family transcriptional regulator
LVVSDTGQPVFAEMVHGVEAAASRAGFTLLLANSGEDPERELRAVAALEERRVDGLIIAQVAGSKGETLELAKKHDVPVVLLDRLIDAKVDQVGVENVKPMRALVRHLVEAGHRRIALIAGDLDVPTLRERRDGYAQALNDCGIPFDPALVVSGSGLPDETEAAVRDLLTSSERPTALVTASSLMAIGALRAAAASGLSCPGDFAFATFDGFPGSDLFTPPLTTVQQPAAEIGALAMGLLLRRLKDPQARPRTKRLDPVITHRSSCGCPVTAPPITS